MPLRQFRPDRDPVHHDFAITPRSAASRSLPHPTWPSANRPTLRAWKARVMCRTRRSTATARHAGPAASGCRTAAPAGSTSTWATPFNINEVRLNWETAYAVNYQIQVSYDALNWMTIEVITGNQSKGMADFSGLSGTGRYVRIHCTQTSAGSDNYSLYDFNVYGTPITDLAQNRPTYASTIESSYYAPAWPSMATARHAGPAASGCRTAIPAGSTSTWAPV